MNSRERISSMLPELMKLLRGPHGQLELSRRLGYNYSACNRWEKGARSVTWADFVKICGIQKIDIRKALFETTGITFKKNLSDSKVVSELNLGGTEESVSVRIFSKQKLNRIKRSESNLLLVDVLLIIDSIYDRLERFLGYIVDLKANQKLSNYFFGLADYNRVLARDPILTVVRIYLDLKQYRQSKVHNDAALAKFVGINQKEGRQKIEVLLKLGVIYLDGKKYKNKMATVDTRLGGEKNSVQIHSFWRSEIARYVKSGKPRNKQDHLAAYLVYSTSDELEQKVFELSNTFYFEMRNLVESYRSQTDAARFMSIEFYNPGKKKT